MSRRPRCRCGVYIDRHHRIQDHKPRPASALRLWVRDHSLWMHIAAARAIIAAGWVPAERVAEARAEERKVALNVLRTLRQEYGASSTGLAAKRALDVAVRRIAERDS